MHAEIIQQLNCAHSVWVSLDIWSSLQMLSYLGISLSADHEICNALLQRVDTLLLTIWCKTITTQSSHTTLHQQLWLTMQQTWWRHSRWRVWDYRWRFRIRQFERGRWYWFQHHCRTRRIWATTYRPQSTFLSYHLARKYGFKGAGQLNCVLVSEDVNHVHKSTIATHWLRRQMRIESDSLAHSLC